MRIDNISGINNQYKNPMPIRKADLSIQNFQKNRQNENTITRNESDKNHNLLKLFAVTTVIAFTVLVITKLSRTSSGKQNKGISKELMEVQEHLKTIFKHDFTNEETENFINRYKEIMKENDDKIWVNKMFDELKKDYNVENKQLTLEIMEKPEPTKNGAGELIGYTDALTRWIGTTICDGRVRTTKNLFHEFRHVKQNELMYRADKERLIKQKVKELEKSNNESWQEILRKQGNKKQARQYVKTQIEETYTKIWGHLSPLDKNSEEYAMGIKYLENEENRIPAGPHYYEQLLEKEARLVENEAEKIFKILDKK